MNLFNSRLARIAGQVDKPDWYMRFGRHYRSDLLGAACTQAAFEGSIGQARDRLRNNTVDIFEDLLSKDAVRLGRPGEDLLVDQDEGRQSPNLIVIHHSHRPNGITNPQLSALELLRLYGPEYAKGMVKNQDGSLQPIFSGHFDKQGKQVFYPYHWMVRQDGTYERLLDDSAFAWHAGNTDINSRSIAICIDDDLTNKRPADESLDSVASIITTHYANIASLEGAIIGHCEASKTECPGKLFQAEWKQVLLDKVASKT